MQKNNRNTPGDTFFAAYVGPSMNPTLREPELMEIVPYGDRPLRVGDVAFFLSPQADQLIVHRIVRMTSAGISTRGDNNTREDPFLLQPKDIKGRVVAGWRGQRRRQIAGGLWGLLISCWLRWRRVFEYGVTALLHPFYRTLSCGGLIAGLLPAPLRPRVVIFQIHGQDRFRLLLGKCIIGRYDDRRHAWQIKRPFRMFVDQRLLQERQNDN